jgi:hypothetical protein
MINSNTILDLWVVAGMVVAFVLIYAANEGDV